MVSYKVSKWAPTSLTLSSSLQSLEVGNPHIPRNWGFISISNDLAPPSASAPPPPPPFAADLDFIVIFGR